ncbi:MAG: hypothetical protein RR449_04675 [Christensenella sp.]
MKMSEEKRMAGNYEILQAIHIGDKEVIFGENTQAEKNRRYMCSFCEWNDIIEYYPDAMVSDNYPEIMSLFTERVQAQIKAVQKARDSLDIPLEVITPEMCFSDHYDQSIKGMIVAVRADALRAEYRSADVQIIYVEGGFGANANARGRKVYGKTVYTGEDCRFLRQNILGEIKPECLPKWAKEKARDIKKQAEKKNNRSDQAR